MIIHYDILGFWEEFNAYESQLQLLTAVISYFYAYSNNSSSKNTVYNIKYKHMDENVEIKGGKAVIVCLHGNNNPMQNYSVHFPLYLFSLPFCKYVNDVEKE